jgi:hypothetical protein
VSRALIALAVVVTLTHLLAVLAITLTAVAVLVVAALLVNRLGRIDRALSQIADQNRKES